MKPDIKEKKDIQLLVRTFYKSIIKNPEIGHFFKDAVSNWDYHLARFDDYWETQVLFKDSFQGSPLRLHIDVDKRFGNNFEPRHFEIWVKAFHQTVDDLFAGEKAELAK